MKIQSEDGRFKCEVAEGVPVEAVMELLNKHAKLDRREGREVIIMTGNHERRYFMRDWPLLMNCTIDRRRSK